MKTGSSRTKVNCPNCKIPTGNLPMHATVCTAPVDGQQQQLLLLAGAHGADPDALPRDARFGPRVTDLTMARLMLALEEGAIVVPGAPYGWCAPGRNGLLKGLLTRAVTEGLRTGLLVSTAHTAGPVRATWIIPAPVHARAARHPSRPACGEGRALRHRLLGGQYIALVGCSDCLDAPLSGVAYSTYE